jgi:hypothetical protein
MEGFRVEIDAPVHNMGPFGTHQYASQFLSAARAVRDNVPSAESPCYLLYCQSLELILKAFLRLKGIPHAELRNRPYGHDLEALLRAANHQGLHVYVGVTAAQDGEIHKANKYYKPREFQYFPLFKALSGYPELPDMHTLDELISALVSKLEELCLRLRA